MSITRANLRGGLATLSWNGATLYGRQKFEAKAAPKWTNTIADLYGVVGISETDRIFRLAFTLWSSNANLPTLFPTSVLNFVRGTRIFGTTDVPLVVNCRNGDVFTYPNAQMTKLANLFLGVGKDFFAADVEFTALLKNATEPDASGAYVLASTGTFTDTAFDPSTLEKERWTGVWTGKTGYTSMTAKEGVNISWDWKLDPDEADAYGTIDMITDQFTTKCTAIPIEPTVANTMSAILSGTKLGAVAPMADLIWTSPAGYGVTLKNAALTGLGHVFGHKELRNGEHEWTSNRSFAAGVPSAHAVIGVPAPPPG